MLLTDDDRKYLLNLVHEYIDKNCIFRCNPNERYSAYEDKGILHKNKGLSYKFYLKNLMYDSKMLYCISALFFDDIIKKIENKEEYSSFQFVGMETSSIPLIIGLQQYAARGKMSINGFTIRKQRSNNGIFNLIDGKIMNSPVIFVDDIIDSTLTIKKTLDICVNELKLEPAKNMYSILKTNPTMEKIKYNEYVINANIPYCLNDFNYEYDPEKYWIPKDCE